MTGDPAQYIDQIGLIFAPVDGAAIPGFLDSEDVGRGRFGGRTQYQGPRGKLVTALQQDDGLKITCQGTDQIQIAYTLPQDARTPADRPLELFRLRTRRFCELFATSYAPQVHWAGLALQLFQPVPDAQGAIDAVGRWLSAANAVADTESLASFSFQYGTHDNGLYGGVLIQGYEIRSMQRQQAEQAQKDGRALLSKDLMLDEAGIEFRIDVNSKPRKTPGTIPGLLDELCLHFEARQTNMLSRARKALGMTNA